MLSSRDGYCTLVVFDEILPAHHTQQHTLQLQSIAHHHSLPLTNSSAVATPLTTPSMQAVGLPAISPVTPNPPPLVPAKRSAEPPLTPAASVDENVLGVRTAGEMLEGGSAEGAPAQDEVREPPKKKRKTSKASAEPTSATPVFDLVEPELPKIKSAAATGRPGPSTVDVYGEATSLQAADAADKQARKKSLRFHAARIENTSARRQNARSNAMGGDDDIPYRERKKEKEAKKGRKSDSSVHSHQVHPGQPSPSPSQLGNPAIYIGAKPKKKK